MVQPFTTTMVTTPMDPSDQSLALLENIAKHQLQMHQPLLEEIKKSTSVFQKLEREYQEEHRSLAERNIQLESRVSELEMERNEMRLLDQANTQESQRLIQNLQAQLRDSRAREVQRDNIINGLRAAFEKIKTCCLEVRKPPVSMRVIINANNNLLHTCEAELVKQKML